MIVVVSGERDSFERERGVRSNLEVLVCLHRPKHFHGMSRYEKRDTTSSAAARQDTSDAGIVRASIENASVQITLY